MKFNIENQISAKSVSPQELKDAVTKIAPITIQETLDKVFENDPELLKSANICLVGLFSNLDEIKGQDIKTFQTAAGAKLLEFIQHSNNGDTTQKDTITHSIESSNRINLLRILLALITINSESIKHLFRDNESSPPIDTTENNANPLPVILLLPTLESIMHPHLTSTQGISKEVLDALADFNDEVPTEPDSLSQATAALSSGD